MLALANHDADADSTVRYHPCRCDAQLQSRGTQSYDDGDENVGEIEDIVIANNKLNGYILSVGGFQAVVGATLRLCRIQFLSSMNRPRAGGWQSYITPTVCFWQALRRRPLA